MSKCQNCGFDQGRNHKRSTADHARLFALVHSAFHQWPEGHRFKPVNPEHLRAWLICAAGGEWQEVEDTLLPGDGASLGGIYTTAKQLLKKQKRFPIIHGNGVVVVIPKSMSFAAMSQAEFGRLRDAITDVIEAEIGCTVADLMQEAA
jgi:hypothetical protein